MRVRVNAGAIHFADCAIVAIMADCTKVRHAVATDACEFVARRAAIRLAEFWRVDRCEADFDLASVH
jgi:hypothetical protein